MNPIQEVDYQHPSLRDQVRFFFALSLLALGITYAYWNGVSAYWLGWVSFAVAAFAVAANDAVQTIGTFIESKKGVETYKKLLALGLLLVLVHGYGWWKDNGQIHFHRLDQFSTATEYTLIQLLAPVILVVITRLRAPVSTTFLVLSLFGPNQIENMFTKSFIGYGLAFFFAILVWFLLAKMDPKEYESDHAPEPISERLWSRIQWISTLFLWGAWLLQDSANIAVFLPRSLTLIELCGALAIILVMLGFILGTQGGTIQSVVSEKSDLRWAKAATIVDFVYGLILLLFQFWSSVPISTTWVFLGLLAGREIVLCYTTSREAPYLDTFRKVGKDVVLAGFGIAVSLGISLIAEIGSKSLDRNSFPIEKGISYEKNAF